MIHDLCWSKSLIDILCFENMSLLFPGLYEANGRFCSGVLSFILEKLGGTYEVSEFTVTHCSFDSTVSLRSSSTLFSSDYVVSSLPLFI